MALEYTLALSLFVVAAVVTVVIVVRRGGTAGAPPVVRQYLPQTESTKDKLRRLLREALDTADAAGRETAVERYAEDMITSATEKNKNKAASVLGPSPTDAVARPNESINWPTSPAG